MIFAGAPCGAQTRSHLASGPGAKRGCAASLARIPCAADDFFHGGFSFRRPITRVLMWLLIITVLSGVFGAALQHYIPRAMTTDVPLETIYDEISRVRTLLRRRSRSGQLSLSAGDLRLSKSSSDAEPASRRVSRRCGPCPRLPFRWRTSAAVSAGASAAVAADS